MKVGHWKHHKYQRHSVERDVEEFAGWKLLSKMVKKARGRDAAFLATAFETGGRVTEVRMLHKVNFDLTNPKVILVRDMRVIKRFHREHGKVVRDIAYRKTFPIPRVEPLVEVMVTWIEQQPEWLFPTNRGDEAYLGRTMSYNIARRMGDSVGLWVYPHWFRAQRASQLRFEYGFDVMDLMEFFAWKHFPTAMRYAKMGWRGLAEKMGVK